MISTIISSMKKKHPQHRPLVKRSAAIIPNMPTINTSTPTADIMYVADE